MKCHSLLWQVAILLGVVWGMSSCQNSDEAKLYEPLEHIILDIEPKKIDGMYKASVVKEENPVVEEGGKEVVYISSITGFDHLYKEGTRYRIKVRMRTMKGSNHTEYYFDEIIKEEKVRI